MNLIPFGLQNQGLPGSSISQYDKLDKKYNFTEFLRENPRIDEKDEDQADTVGCCSLRVEHIDLFEVKDDKENLVQFDFLGKDSIRYQNEVEVEKRVFKNLKLFRENKKGEDDLFDRLNTSILNQYLQQLMEGLTAKVFR